VNFAGAEAPDEDPGEDPSEDPGEDPDDDDGPSGGLSGGTGGGGGASGGADDVEPPEAPTDVDVESEETTDLVRDDETGTTTATFGEDNTVESVTFGIRASGTVNARTLSAESDETGPAPGASVAVSQITVGSALDGTEATVRKRISQERLDEIDAPPEDLCLPLCRWRVAGA